MQMRCPRCKHEAAQVGYGPCVWCRGELRIWAIGRVLKVEEAEEYEPKMNVTPNAVALKDG
jgi:hypothetical protein